MQKAKNPKARWGGGARSERGRTSHFHNIILSFLERNGRRGRKQSPIPIQLLVVILRFPQAVYSVPHVFNKARLSFERLGANSCFETQAWSFFFFSLFFFFGNIGVSLSL